MTYLAEEGRIMKQEDGRALLIMRNGHIQRQNGKSKVVQIVVFDSYLFDISQFGPKEGPRDFKPRERFLGDLLNPDPNDAYYKQNAGKFRSELHDRLSNPLYPILFVLIVGVHLGYPRTTRDEPDAEPLYGLRGRGRLAGRRPRGRQHADEGPGRHLGRLGRSVVRHCRHARHDPLRDPAAVAAAIFAEFLGPP